MSLGQYHYRMSELSLSPTARDKEALRRMRSCRWNYGFEVHLKGIIYEANKNAIRMIWC